jgi:hypothetical protein
MLARPEFDWQGHTMKATGVDPRDLSREGDYPIYRVYFWRRSRPAEGDERVSWNSDEWRLTEVMDVSEVLVWAEENAGPDQLYAVYVEFRDGDSIGLLRLAGVADPNDHDGCAGADNTKCVGHRARAPGKTN